MAQVALSFVALASAGMFLRSLANARGIDPGFDGSRLAVLGINPGTQGFDEARTRELYRRVTERMRGVAGVEAVTLATSVPLFGGGFGRTVFRDGQDTEGSAQRAHDADEPGGRRLLRGAGHPGGEGPRLHRRRPRRIDAGGGDQRGDGQADLAQRRSHRPDLCGSSATTPRGRSWASPRPSSTTSSARTPRRTSTCRSNSTTPRRSWCTCARLAIRRRCWAPCGANCSSSSRACRC